jgi:hypothetical protein
MAKNTIHNSKNHVPPDVFHMILLKIEFPQSDPVPYDGMIGGTPCQPAKQSIFI